LCWAGAILQYDFNGRYVSSAEHIESDLLYDIFTAWYFVSHAHGDKINNPHQKRTFVPTIERTDMESSQLPFCGRLCPSKFHWTGWADLYVSLDGRAVYTFCAFVLFCLVVSTTALWTSAGLRTNALYGVMDDIRPAC
jgi:hypothetical protein